jgi:hypothetical protein
LKYIQYLQFLTPGCIADPLGDCRKSPKMEISEILHSIKSVAYKHQNHRFRVFRQSLEISVVLKAQIYCR